MSNWDRRLKKALKSARAITVWGPHRRDSHLAVCLREFDTPNGYRVLKGSQIQFCKAEYRDKWLAAQHPKKWAKLARKWAA